MKNNDLFSYLEIIAIIGVGWAIWKHVELIL